MKIRKNKNTAVTGIVNGTQAIKRKTGKLTEKLVAGVKSKINGAKAVAKKAASKVTKAIANTIANVMSGKLALNKVVQGYRVWKALDLEGYRAQGHGTIANIRHIEMIKIVDRGIGQNVILHKSDLGYGYTHGKAIDARTIHAGFVVVRFDAKNVVASFKTYADFVSYVKKHGETGIGATSEWKTMSNGGRYSLYTNGKQVIRHESAGSASGHYQDFQSSGKYFGKFAALKTT